MPDRKICLIQLVSEETMQNLLPILALKPASVVHVCTTKTAKRSNWIVEGARQSNVSVFKKDIQLDEMPDIKNTYEAVEKAIKDSSALGQTPIVNFTGGTKLMSVGAHQAARECKVDSFYVDTEHLHFTDGETSSGLNSIFNGDFSFSALSRSLSVDSIAVANGSERITGGKDWKKYSDIADFILLHPDDERKCWDAINKGLFNSRNEPREISDWKSFKNKRIEMPADCGELAVKAGLLEKSASNFILPTKRIDELNHNPKTVENLKFITSFFSGGWWEIPVVKAASGCGLFQDVRWSVNVGGGHSSKEEDIVAIHGVQAVYISCKRGGTKSRLLGQLDELDNRAKTIGGRFVKKFLAVYLPIYGKTEDNVRKRGAELNVKIIQTKDLKNPQETFSIP